MDMFLWIVSALSQAGMAVLGFWITLDPRLAEAHPKTLTICFGSLLVLALIASSLSFRRSDNESATVSILTEQILNEVKGSPDCILEIHPNFTKSQGGDYEEGICTFQYYNDSQFPMIDTTVGIVGTHYLHLSPYGRRLGDIRPDRGGTLPGLTVTLPKDKPSSIEFSIDCRSVTLWQRIYFQWNGKGWVVDDTIFKEVTAKKCT